MAYKLGLIFDSNLGCLRKSARIVLAKRKIMKNKWSYNKYIEKNI